MYSGETPQGDRSRRKLFGKWMGGGKKNRGGGTIIPLKKGLSKQISGGGVRGGGAKMKIVGRKWNNHNFGERGRFPLRRHPGKSRFCEPFQTNGKVFGLAVIYKRKCRGHGCSECVRVPEAPAKEKKSSQ